MEDNNVKFIGTISHLSTEKTTNKFEGSGKLSWPGSASPIAVAIAFSLALTLSLVVLKQFGVDINLMCAPPGTIGAATETKDGIVAPLEPLPRKLKELGIEGYIVVISEFNDYSKAKELEYILRQRRVHANHLVCDSRYYVYVGPLYGKQHAMGTLNTVSSLGFNGAKIVTPE